MSLIPIHFALFTRNNSIWFSSIQSFSVFFLISCTLPHQSTLTVYILTCHHIDDPFIIHRIDVCALYTFSIDTSCHFALLLLSFIRHICDMCIVYKSKERMRNILFSVSSDDWWADNTKFNKQHKMNENEKPTVGTCLSMIKCFDFKHYYRLS